MSYRLYRYMGWGMSANMFKKHTGKDVDGLYDIFEEVTELVVPKTERERIFNARFVPSIVFSDLLRIDPASTENLETARNAGDLFDFLMDTDNIHGVVFYPNKWSEMKWSRSFNDMDYQFETWRSFNNAEGSLVRHGIRGQQSDPRDFITYMPYGIYPYTNNVMTKDGQPHEWLPYWEMEKRPDLVPAIPSEIRWYLKYLGVMNDEGVNQLRPLIAQMWS